MVARRNHNQKGDGSSPFSAIEGLVGLRFYGGEQMKSFTSDRSHSISPLTSSIPNPKTILIIGIVAFMVIWNIADAQSLTQAVGNAYVALSVVCFTLAWVVALVASVIWLSRLVARGEEAEGLDLVKAAQERLGTR